MKGKAEKGVDVLCALALVRQALDPDIDLVILASQDSDLEPALAEASAFGSAKVETFSWYTSARRHKSTEISSQGTRLWNTRLGETEFKHCWDRKEYR